MKHSAKFFCLALALVLCFVSVFPGIQVSAETQYLDGDWEKAKIADSNCTWNIHAFRLDETLSDCKSFDLEFDVTMNYGARCKNWNVWAGYCGSYSKIGSIYLADGDGYVSKTIKLRNATTFDAIAVTPTVSGSYSWSFSLGISNPVTSSASQSSSSSSGSVSTGDILSGEWESLRLGNCNTHAFVFDTSLKRCTQLSIDMDVTMYSGTHCYEWKVWSGSNGSYSEIGTIELPGGDGTASETLYFKNPRSFDSIAITPVVSGNYSFSLGFVVYDVVCK